MRKLGLLIDSDSQFFGTQGIAGYFLKNGWQVDYVVPDLAVFPEKLANELTKRFSVVNASLDQFCFTEGLNSYTAVGCYSRGSQIRRFQRNIAHLHEKVGSRPYIFTGYNGVIYEKYEEGIFWRCGYDSICVNGQRDLELFKAILSGTVAHGQKIIPLGLNRPTRDGAGNSERRRVVFAEQVIVPATVDERNRLFKALSEFAKANGAWDIVVKPRVPQGGQTFHEQVLHPEQFKDWPGNVQVSHDPLPDLMREAQALLSVSSTAFFDAISFGLIPLCVMDFGVNSTHGTHFFVGCGTEMSLRDNELIENLLDKEVCSTWLARTGYNLNAYRSLVEDIETWSECPLPAAFSEKLLNTTRGGRLAAKKPTEDVMLLEQSRSLFAEGEFAALAQLIEKERRRFAADPHASYLAAECFEALGKYRIAFEWLKAVYKQKPRWSKTRRKAVSIAWKWLKRPQ